MPAPPPSSTPLARLQAGDIDLDGYLDLLVSEAVAPLGGLSAHELRALRLDLRGRLQTDPTLCELVQLAARSPNGNRP